MKNFLTTRITIALEDEQDSQRTRSVLGGNFGQFEDLFPGAECCEVDALAPLYNIEASFDKGGFLHELRTHEECIALIAEAMPKNNPGLVFEGALAGKYVDGMTEITVSRCDWNDEFLEEMQGRKWVSIAGEKCVVDDTDPEGLVFHPSTKEPAWFLNSDPLAVKIGLNTWSVLDVLNARHVIHFPGDTDGDADAITDILKNVFARRGMDGVQSVLRSACGHFAAEYTGEDTDVPDSAVLSILSDAVAR